MTNEDDVQADGAEVDISDLFPLVPGEERLIGIVIQHVRNSLKYLPPDELRSAANFLFALERLPYATSGMEQELARIQRINEDTDIVSMELSGDSLSLSISGAQYNEGVGSDSFSETLVEMERGGYREGHISAFENWVERFLASTGELQFEGYCDDDIDLSQATPTDGWDRLSAYWEQEGDGEFEY